MFKTFILSTALFLIGCSASGPSYSNLSPSITEASTGSKIIVYRESNFINGTARFWVEMNGIEVCRLHNGSFLIHDVEPGKVTIASSNFGSYGTSRITVNAKPRKTVYIKMTMNGGRVMAGTLGGAIANATDEAIEENSGPVYLGEVNAQTAKTEMANMNYEDGCK